MSLGTAILKSIESSPIPISSPDLIAIHATGLSDPRSRVWDKLRMLERNGYIRKVSRSPKGTKWIRVLDNPEVKGRNKNTSDQ